MSLTLLQLVQRSAVRLGIGSPPTALTTVAAAQLIEFARESGEDLMKRHDWEVLKTDVSFTGPLPTQALAEDHDRFLSPAVGELWSIGVDYPCRGPLNDRDWTALALRQIGSIPPAWSLRNGVINIFPVPAVSDEFFYAYISRNWIVPSGGGDRIADWASDADTTIFPDDAMRYGMIWRWRQAKGFYYTEDMATAELAIERAISRDRGPRVVDVARTWDGIPGDPWPDGVFPGLIVP